MPRQKTREELKDRIDELEAENETLQDQVDSIADIIEGEDEDDEGKECVCKRAWLKSEGCNVTLYRRCNFESPHKQLYLGTSQRGSNSAGEFRRPNPASLTTSNTALPDGPRRSR